jgi:lysyl oxidase
VYGNSLDCQWIDVTGLPSGNYQLSVSVNPSRTFEEVSFDNNVTTVPVTLP